ncbi:ER membrane protein complex subunit 9 isoform X10 [Rhinolophus sinicus]|uniref:ER membrane protein complex subunit 9 isoform X10 n=1 Tax=Rhinolophus sinicus TaxID=89399 RepID=UPI003D7BC30E
MPVPHRLCAPVPQPPGPVCHAGGRPQPGGCVGRAGRSGSGWVLPRQCSSERPEWLSTCFPQHSSIKQLCMKHQAGLTPLPWPSPGPLALKIAGRIAEFFPDAVLIMLDNQKLVPQSHVPPVIVLENHGARWVPKDKNLVMWRDWEESRQMVGALLEGRAYQHLVDFDCHLDDIRQDWTNQQLNTRITQWVGPSNGNV